MFATGLDAQDMDRVKVRWIFVAIIVVSSFLKEIGDWRSGFSSAAYKVIMEEHVILNLLNLISEWTVAYFILEVIKFITEG